MCRYFHFEPRELLPSAPNPMPSKDNRDAIDAGWWEGQTRHTGTRLSFLGRVRHAAYLTRAM